MKKLTIEIVELPDHDGYEARIPELGEAIYRGCGNSEEEALESLGLVMWDLDAKKTCTNCRFWKKIKKEYGECSMIAAHNKLNITNYLDENLVAITNRCFWCCEFEEK